VNRRIQQGAATRERLVEVATASFAADGYEATSIDTILEAAGISRGSLYHHFGSKQQLFEAALIAVDTRVKAEFFETITDGAQRTPREALRVAALLWMRLAADPLVRIILEAPAVLGWDHYRDVEERSSLDPLRTLVQLASDDGEIAAGLVDVYAHILLGSLTELVFYIARQDDTAAAQLMAETAIDDFLGRLLPGVAPTSNTPSRRTKR
jgi:AcrR family transcriptional regulator